jgi:hypothetical protein
MWMGKSIIFVVAEAVTATQTANRSVVPYGKWPASLSSPLGEVGADNNKSRRRLCGILSLDFSLPIINAPAQIIIDLGAAPRLPPSNSKIWQKPGPCFNCR